MFDCFLNLSPLIPPETRGMTAILETIQIQSVFGKFIRYFIAGVMMKRQQRKHLETSKESTCKVGSRQAMLEDMIVPWNDRKHPQCQSYR